MALDREKVFADAERLLKGGKPQPALDELRKLGEEAARDAIVLNRIGDLVARFGHNADAVVYYHRSADELARSGFYPKAIAVAKKIQKIDPARVETLIQLGDLYLKQRLAGEARAFLLAASDQLRKARQFTKAREVHERLVHADPEDLEQRALLAELRSAEGDRERAGKEFAELARHLERAGRFEEAQKAWTRATEFLPNSADARTGVARSLAARGQIDEAIGILEAAVDAGDDDPAVVGDLYVLLETAGHGERAARFLASPLADVLPVEAVERALRRAVEHGREDEAWSRLDTLLARWASGGRTPRMVAVLERLAGIQSKGYLPALERLVLHRRRAGDPAALVKIVERTIRASRIQGRTARADELAGELRRLDPSAGVSASPMPPAPAEPAPVREEAPAPISPQAEAPAVPLTPADQEMVSGGMTEAEVFQKYGLEAEALSQLRKIAERFPGYVPALEKLAQSLRVGGDRRELQKTLVLLAFARRAAGDNESARRAALDAEGLGPIEAASRRDLEAGGLLRSSGTAAPPAAAPAPLPTRSEEAPVRAAAPKPPAPKPAPPSEVVIDFDEEFAAAPAEPVAPVESPVEAPLPTAAAETERLDEDELFSITEALERELGPDIAEAPDPASHEQSIEEVFGEFKKHVEAEIGRDDFRTRYDLGIAYKEMGLIDDAIEEFTVATGSPMLFREACSMLAVCHRERGALAEAAAWYGRALESPDPSDDLSGLRYDLADVLEAAGDLPRALALFDAVAGIAPAYRDAKRRADALRSRLGG